MSYTLQRFGTIVLPIYNRTTDMTPVQPRTALLATAAGAFDAWGSERAPRKFPHTITMSCILHESVAATYRSSIDALRAAVGTRAKLSRVADNDLTMHQCTARLMDMDYQRSSRHRSHQELKLVFQQLDEWLGKRAEDWVFDDGSTFDDGLYFDTGDVALKGSGSNVISVGGNVPTTSIRLSMTIVTSDANPIYVVFDEAGVALKIAGPWTAADVIYIDGAARTITVNGADAYAKLNLDDGYTPSYPHTATDWLVLALGTNTILLRGTAITDAGNVAVMEYAEAWA